MAAAAAAAAAPAPEYEKLRAYLHVLECARRFDAESLPAIRPMGYVLARAACELVVAVLAGRPAPPEDHDRLRPILPGLVAAADYMEGTRATALAHGDVMLRWFADVPGFTIPAEHRDRRVPVWLGFDCSDLNDGTGGRARLLPLNVRVEVAPYYWDEEHEDIYGAPIDATVIGAMFAEVPISKFLDGIGLACDPPAASPEDGQRPKRPRPASDP